jgi:DNA-binding response OmpR family regulator
MAAGTKRILVVDDEPGIRETMADILRLEGYRVDTADQGESGLTAFKKQPAELIVSDLVMPVMDGVEMVRQLRKQNPGLKVLFMSGYFGGQDISPELIETILEMGYPTLKKPFRAQELLEKVREMLD